MQEIKTPETVFYLFEVKKVMGITYKRDIMQTPENA